MVTLNSGDLRQNIEFERVTRGLQGPKCLFTFTWYPLLFNTLNVLDCVTTDSWCLIFTRSNYPSVAHFVIVLDGNITVIFNLFSVGFSQTIGAEKRGQEGRALKIEKGTFTTKSSSFKTIFDWRVGWLAFFTN